MKLALRLSAVLILSLLLSFLIVRLTPAANPVSYVVDAGGANATCATWTIIFTPNNPGDTWFLVVGTQGSTTNPVPTSISDNNGGSWFLQTVGGTSMTNGVVGVATSPNHGSGATTITITEASGSGTCGQAAYIYEFHNVGTPQLDQVVTNTAAGVSTTWSAGTTGTLQVPTEIAIAGFVSKRAGATVASATSPTNGFTQSATGVLQDSGKQGAFDTSYNITSSTSALSTTLTASASVTNSLSVLATFFLGAVPLPPCSATQISVGFGCASNSLGVACGGTTCDPQQVCFNGPANPQGATPAPQCLAQCTLINSFDTNGVVFVNGCNALGPCPCGQVAPTATPTNLGTPTASPTFTAVPTQTLPPPFPTPHPTATGTASTPVPTPTPASNCVQPYSNLTGVCVTGSPCLCGQACASGATLSGNQTVCPGGSQIAQGACVQNTSPSTGVFVAPSVCPGGGVTGVLPDAIINCFSKTKFCIGCQGPPGVLTLTCLPTACFQAAAGLVPSGDMTAIYNCQTTPGGPNYGACLATFWDKSGGPSSCPVCTPKTYSTNPNDYIGSVAYNPSLPCP